MNKRTRSFLLVIVQLLIIFFTAWAVGSMFFVSGSGNMRVRRYTIFRYFTVDSNILCAVSCIFPLFPKLRGSKGVMLLRYAGTTAVTVTMMTVLLFLGPMYGYPSMFSDWNLWLHLLGPLLAILSFVFLEKDSPSPEKKHLIFSMLPVILYGIVYLVMVVIIGKDNGGWPDFYGFNMGGRWYVSYIIMLAATALLGWALAKAKKSCSKTNRKQHRHSPPTTDAENGKEDLPISYTA